MKPTQDFNFKRWVWPITYGILLFFLLQNIGRLFNLADGMMGPVSYTHLDVYKRQALAWAGERAAVWSEKLRMALVAAV